MLSRRQTKHNVDYSYQDRMGLEVLLTLEASGSLYKQQYFGMMDGKEEPIMKHITQNTVHIVDVYLNFDPCGLCHTLCVELPAGK